MSMIGYEFLFKNIKNMMQHFVENRKLEVFVNSPSNPLRLLLISKSFDRITRVF